MKGKKSKEKPWFKDRGYLHLTNRISNAQEEDVLNFVTNKEKILKHKFSPLILRESKIRRYKYSEDFNRRSHKAVDDKGNIFCNLKVRPIMYATHIDSNIYSYYAHKIIQPKYEAYLSENIELNKAITAYRRIETEDKLRYKYNVDFAKEVFEEVKRREDCVALAFDIKNFFPSLNHKQLKTIWSKILGTKSLPKDHYSLYKSITKYSYFNYDDLRTGFKGTLDEKKIAKLRNQGKFQLFKDYWEFKESGIQVYKNHSKVDGILAGIPQGLPISALLANLYMLPFDEEIVEKLVQSRGCYYRRYSDDLVVICDPDDMEFVEQTIKEEIGKIKLIISESKTEKFRFKKTNNRIECYKIKDDDLIPNSYLQYLGFDFYGYKTLIKSANISRFYREMKESIAMKAKRVEQIQEKNLTNEAIIFKRKIYRLYSFKGVQSRELPARRIVHYNGKLETKKFNRKYRGNFIKYAYRASDILEAPEIRRQMRRHMIILKNYMKQFEFDNAP